MHGEDDDLDGDETMRRHDRVPRSGLPVVAPESGAHRVVGRRTPRVGVPALRRTDPLGYSVPEEIVDAPSRRSSSTAADDSGPIGTLEERVVVLERGARGFRRRLWGLLGGVVASVGAVLIWALNAREAAGAEKAQLRYLEQAVSRIEARIETFLYSAYRDSQAPRQPPPARKDEP